MKSQYLQNDVIAAIATPPGNGAIGILRLSGHNSIQIASPFLSLPEEKPLDSLPPQKLTRAVLRGPKSQIDHALVAIFPAPHSYTGEEMVEIYCHGGSLILQQALELFLQNGARIAEPGEFTQRAFLNGKMDLAQAESVADLIQAQTEISRQAAFSQLEGNLSKTIHSIRTQLLETLAHIEVAIDHSDDPASGIEIQSEKIREMLSHADKQIRKLIQSFQFGHLLKEGARIAIVGKPNVGKSSLLNKLLKRDRAIVTVFPGTTRDTLEEGFDLLGLPALLIDTAGIRNKTSDLVEGIGIERTLRTIQSADGLIVVLDSSQPISQEDQNVAELAKNKKQVVVALNKSDLDRQIDLEKVTQFFSPFQSHPISASQGDGIEELLRQLYSLLLASQNGNGNSQPEVIVTSVRHKDCLLRCAQSLERASSFFQEEMLEECLAVEIRDAVDSLGEIVGETTTEEILQTIFSKFCIGK
ncbi:MAG: tRNA uridine-5-carboxymethylaminomethyl(34) synthesis GTPase MnmE [Elusimicrobia bacterium]|nr:tRNA uridine-5-carboxymethylaminomethyl(34) synthesis GTPase MnmE [Elusimicrobiota bacterium]